MAAFGRIQNNQSGGTAKKQRRPMEREHDQRLPLVHKGLHGISRKPREHAPRRIVPSSFVRLETHEILS